MATCQSVFPPRSDRQWLRAMALSALLLILLPAATVLAAPPNPEFEGPEKCVLCHQTEVDEWQNSPHANALNDLNEATQLACVGENVELDCTCLTCHTTDFDIATRTYSHSGITCEACHGPYVEEHPGNGVMQLNVDSSICSDCHVDTHQQWLESNHGQAGVQCIGCHRAHSQNLRLTDEALCESCHRDRLMDSGHAAHINLDITCLSCHASPKSEATAMVSADSTLLRMGDSPSHTFDVAHDACAGCHGDSFHGDSLAMTSSAGSSVESVAAEECSDAVVSELATTKEANKSLQNMTAISLGLGIGVGSMLGIVFFLVIGYIAQGRAKS